MDDDVVRKYDGLAADYSSRYADPAAVVAFYVQLVRFWGSPLVAGGSVLEISCADGFMTEGLVRAGYRVTALDVAPAMVEAAATRLSRAGLQADLRVADIRTWEPDARWDVVVAPMWTFFHYVDDPQDVLARMAQAASVKVIVDLNPRERPIQQGVQVMRAAGLRGVQWRPVPIPLTRTLGPAGSAVLRTAMSLTPVRDAVLKRRFNVALMGATGAG
jgi:2-polyprenyl-3-methyl-5-hydroxy-6-metoxy-1,4-benzoquinol methylase